MASSVSISSVTGFTASSGFSSPGSLGSSRSTGDSFTSSGWVVSRSLVSSKTFSFNSRHQVLVDLRVVHLFSLPNNHPVERAAFFFSAKRFEPSFCFFLARASSLARFPGRFVLTKGGQANKGPDHTCGG